MKRSPLPVALARAVVVDAARVMVTVGTWLVLDPSLCRLLGHNEQAIYDTENALVVVVCIRCGKTV